MDKAFIKNKLNQSYDCSPLEDRCYAWLIILDIFSIDSEDWKRKGLTMKNTYESYINDFGITNWHMTPLDHGSKLEFRRKSIMDLIHSDIIRSKEHLCFLPNQSIKSDEFNDSLLSCFGEHMRRQERILYTFACLNPWIEYMQGFNEILQPLYYCVFSSSSLFHDDKELMECVVFNMFSKLLTMTDLPDFFAAQKDEDQIEKLLQAPMSALMKKYCPRVHSRFEQLSIRYSLFAYRWFCVLFSQEFPMPDLVSIWDSLFAHIEDILLFAFLIGIGFLIELECRILEQDFAGIMNTLHSIPTNDIKKILIFANNAWALERPKNTPDLDISGLVCV